CFAVGAQRGRVARITVRRVARERGPVVPGLQRVDEVAAVERAGFEGELVGRLPRDVHAQRALLLIVRLDASLFLTVAAGHEVSRAVRTALHAYLVFLVRPLADERLVQVEGARAIRTREVRIQVRRIIVRRLVVAAGEAHVPLRRVLEASLLGE